MLSRKSVKGARTDAASGPNDAKPAGAPVPDERDGVIQRLEQTLVEERKNSATLRETVDNLRFKSETLEKSYAKQLADARQRCATAEQALAAHNTAIAAFGNDREETIRLLTNARTELEQVKLDRDQLRTQLNRGNKLDRSPLTSASTDAPVGEGTINQLIANADWLKKGKESAGGNSHLEAKVSADQESPPIEMIAPDLVFTKGSDDEDDDA